MGHAPGCLDLGGHGAAAILAQRAVRFPDAECASKPPRRAKKNGLQQNGCSPLLRRCPARQWGVVRTILACGFSAAWVTLQLRVPKPASRVLELGGFGKSPSECGSAPVHHGASARSLAGRPPLPGSWCGCDRGIRRAGTALARPSVHALRARCQCLGLLTWAATAAQSAVWPLNTSSGRHLRVQPSMSPCAYPTPGIPPFITRRSHRQDEWKLVTA